MRLSDKQYEIIERLVSEGYSPKALAGALNILPATVERAAAAWRGGHGQVARAAKHRGRWPRTGEVPDGPLEPVVLVKAFDVSASPRVAAPVAPVVLTPTVVRLLAKAKAEGQTWRALADTVGMSVLGVTNAVNGWNAGRSRLARQAQAEGTWEAFG